MYRSQIPCICQYTWPIKQILILNNAVHKTVACISLTLNHLFICAETTKTIQTLCVCVRAYETESLQPCDKEIT